MSNAVRLARWLGIGLLLIGYPVLAHYTNVNAHNGQFGAVVAVAPVFVIGLVYALKSSPRWLWLSMFAMSGAAAASSWSLLEQHFGVLYWLQDAGMQCLLFMTFARTLVAGRKPLCTQLAEMAHGEITPQHAHYAHQVTWAWAWFFGLMATVSTLLFFLTPLTTWSVFANFLTLPLVAFMFIAEHWVRRRVLPERSQRSIADTFQIWKNKSKSKSMNRAQHAE